MTTGKNETGQIALDERTRAIAFNFTPAAKRKFRRRLEILHQWRELIARGLSMAAAAKALHKPYITLYRWARRPEPNTHKCGQKSVFKKLNVPVPVISRVQRLQLAGMSNADAWRAVAKEPICPDAVADCLKTAKTIPPSFLKGSRLVRITVKAVMGIDFTVMERRVLK